MRTLLKPEDSPVHLSDCKLPSALLAKAAEKLSMRAWPAFCENAQSMTPVQIRYKNTRKFSAVAPALRSEAGESPACLSCHLQDCHQPSDSTADKCSSGRASPPRLQSVFPVLAKCKRGQC